MPDVHPHALKGAIVSLAVMWRLPVLHARDPEDALRILQLLAHQARNSDPRILQRYDRKPKRLASRKLYMLQGLPGVGPAFANRLLVACASSGWRDRRATAARRRTMRASRRVRSGQLHAGRVMCNVA